MRYVFGLCFTYHRYHHDARVRIFADEHLVDEFQLSEDIKLKVKAYVNRPFSSFNQHPSNYSRIFFVPEKLFSFTIDEKYLTKNIRVSVKNDSNNYTNGFMSEWSWINFKFIFLIPECLLELENWQRLERVDSWADGLPPYRCFPVIPESPQFIKLKKTTVEYNTFLLLELIKIIIII